MYLYTYHINTTKYFRLCLYYKVSKRAHKDLAPKTDPVRERQIDILKRHPEFLTEPKREINRIGQGKVCDTSLF